ncbi:MAG: hypothetical protein AAGG47_17525, partial [Pseudomonadota bacterium]
ALGAAEEAVGAHEEGCDVETGGDLMLRARLAASAREVVRARAVSADAARAAVREAAAEVAQARARADLLQSLTEAARAEQRRRDLALEDEALRALALMRHGGAAGR